MGTHLDPEETRIIGCLIEKSLVTPDQYPLSLNALTNACNQKSGRNPVMSLSQGNVRRTCQRLADRSLLRIDENFKSGVEKFSQRFCNTRYSDYRFAEAELALVTALLLRGPQTPGELRANCRRLHEFSDNAAVVDVLDLLAAHERGALVERLPRAPGRRDSEYRHLWSGAPARSAPGGKPAAPAVAVAPRADNAGLEQRIARLEAEVAELRARLEGRESAQ